MNACNRCGMPGGAWVTHICAFAGLAYSRQLSSVPTPQPDLSWLYKAGYDAGYAAALRERDLTPTRRE